MSKENDLPTMTEYRVDITCPRCRQKLVGPWKPELDIRVVGRIEAGSSSQMSDDAGWQKIQQEHQGDGSRFSSSRGKFLSESGFVECDACRSKNGSPVLCYGCLHNRTIIEERDVQIRVLEEKVAELRKLLETGGRTPLLTINRDKPRSIKVKLDGWSKEYTLIPEDTELHISLDAVMKDAIKGLISDFSSGRGIYGVCKEDGEFSRGVQFAVNRMRKVFGLEDNND